MAEIISDETFGESHIVRVPQMRTTSSTSGSNRIIDDYIVMFCCRIHSYIYTWPLSGVISIDIFSCNAEDNVDINDPYNTGVGCS